MKNIETDIRLQQQCLFKFVLIHAGIGALAGSLIVAALLLTNTLNLWFLIISTNNILMELVAIILASVFLFAPLAVITAVTFFLPSDID